MTSDNKSGRLRWYILTNKKVFDYKDYTYYSNKIVGVCYSIISRAFFFFFPEQIWEDRNWDFQWIDYANKFWILLKI